MNFGGGLLGGMGAKPPQKPQQQQQQQSGFGFGLGGLMGATKPAPQQKKEQPKPKQPQAQTQQKKPATVEGPKTQTADGKIPKKPEEKQATDSQAKAPNKTKEV